MVHEQSHLTERFLTDEALQDLVLPLSRTIPFVVLYGDTLLRV